MKKPTSAAAASVAEWSEKKAKRRGPPTVSTARFESAIAEATEMLKSGEWDGAKPVHLVALYAWCHERVYGIACADLAAPRQRGTAAVLAASMTKVHFDGDVPRAVAFLRWTWARERGREEWRRDNRRSGGSIGWRLQFSPRLVTEYRLDVARTEAR